MTRVSPVAAVALSCIVGLALVSAEQTFRSGVALVTMNVAVRRNNAPVRGLAAGDFEVTDNSVAQKVELTPMGAMPVDITLLVDTSGSMDGTLDQLRGHLRDVSRSIRHDDRIRVLTVADDVREVFGFRLGGAASAMESLTAGGWTSLYDALSLAFIHRPSPGRGHVIVAFSDGIDSSSTLDLATLGELAKRSDAVLYTFVMVPKPVSFSRRAMPSREVPPSPPVAGIASLTGGATYFIDAAGDIPSSFRAALDEFRHRYVLRYPIPTWAPGRWHNVKVTIRREGRFDVRARRGYVE